VSNPSALNPPLALPVGTQIITRVAVHTADSAAHYAAGAVGTVITTPEVDGAGYRVRFPDGGEATLARADLRVRKHLHAEGLLTADGGFDAVDYVIYRCVVGSRAYGLDTPDSDIDRRGIYLPPARRHWSLAGVPEQWENEATQECYWELSKFLILALKANPNVLECLYTPLVETATPLAEQLRGIRGIFLSRFVYQTYNGYVISQFKKLEQDLRTTGTLKWKHAMHLIRLLLAGIVVLREGYVPVPVGNQRDALLAIRRGQVPWTEVNAWRLRLHQEFDAALAATRLPEHPDYAQADAFLIGARRSMVEEV
jgi:hypothetical protein